MTMQFGIFDHLDDRKETLSRFYDERIAFIRSAEAAGFRAYHLAEHHGTPLGMAPSPNVFLSAVARSTRTIRFGAMVYCLPLYIPLRLLEEICMLDHLSNGRLDVGVGRGASPFETGFYGIDANESVSRYSETLDIIRTGLVTEKLNYTGTYSSYKDVPVEIKPVQTAIPFWAAPATPESQIFAARYGMNVMSLGANTRVKELSASYKKLWHENVDNPLRKNQESDAPLIGAYRLIFVTNNEKEIESIARPAFDHWFNNLCKLWWENDAQTPFMSIEYFDTAREIGMVICGNCNQVIDILTQQIEQCDYNYPVLQFTFGNLGHVNEMKSLELFATYVMPQLSQV